MKYIKFIIAFILLIQGTSCVKEILDKEPISNYSATDFYKTESDCQAGVIGIYSAAQSVFRVNSIYWGEGRADNVYTSQEGESLLLSNNNLTMSLASSDWSGLYKLISRANYAIKYIPDVYSSDDVNGNQLIAEAKALRALAYFYLVMVWGDVPLITEPYTTIDQDIYVSRTDKDEVLDQIEEDLTYASQNCKERFGSDNDRIMFTQGGANALLTKVYMWRHNYAKALETSQLVLNNSLYSLEANMDGWSSIFVDGYSKESIFEVAYDGTNVSSNLRVFYALQDYAVYTPSSQFISSYETGDLRIDYVYDVTETVPSLIWKFFGKGFDDNSTAVRDQNIVLIRLADIMLLRAEALFQTGGSANITEALELLNAIRNRAGLTAFATEADANAMYGDLESAILHERSIELCFEGQRWFDLVRTGTAISTMGPINGLSDERNLVWPISVDIMVGDPNLVQNEFYQ